MTTNRTPLDDAALDAAADRLAEHLRRTSARAGASFGHVCDDAGPLGLFVVPAELLADLGGPGAGSRSRRSGH